MQSKRVLRSNIFSSSESPSWRTSALSLVAILGVLLVIFRLYSLQVVAHQTYRSLAENQHKFFQELIPKRGEVYLNNNQSPYPLAVNQAVQMAFAVPREITDREAVIRKVTSLLGLEESEVREKIGDPEDRYEILKRRLTDEEAQKLREENLSGIYLSPEDVRFYPAGDLASQVIGFVGSDGTETNGRYGIEAFWEKELKGETGSLFQERDNRGRWISVSDRDLKEAKDGSDLVLTIDYTLQYETEKILKETVEKHQADGGTVIIMEPSTGKILALANAPSFNPNEFGKAENMEVFLNPAVSGTYECGSVFKTITAAIGIDSGKIRPETTFTDTGVIHEAGYAIKNSDGKAYGRQTMTEVLEKSLNTGAIFIEQSIGNRMFQEYLKRFGFGERTGIELPGEVPGNVSNLNNLKRDINFFTASFGQGISVTPLQLLNAYATIANGGKLMKPQIVERIVDPSGSEKEIEPEELRRVISEEAARETGRMLRSVVVTGHGKRADVPGYLVGGKTGTAEVAKAGAKGYEEGLTIGSFAGYAPIDNPRFAILVKITNPKGVQWAESTAAPAFGKIMKFALEYYKVESTEPIDVKKLNAASELENSPLIPAVQPDN